LFFRNSSGLRLVIIFNKHLPAVRGLSCSNWLRLLREVDRRNEEPLILTRLFLLLLALEMFLVDLFIERLAHKALLHLGVLVGRALSLVDDFLLLNLASLG